METKVLALLSATFIALVAGFVVLTLVGQDTDKYATFVGVMILPTIAAAYAAKNAGQARDLAQTAVTNTNGNLTALMEKNKRLIDIIESHGIKTTPAEKQVAAENVVAADPQATTLPAPPTTDNPAVPPTGSATP